MPHPPQNSYSFLGFEPQSAAEQKARLLRSVEMSKEAWGFQIDVDKGREDDGIFHVTAKGQNWQTETQAEAVSIGHFVNQYAAKPFIDRLITGYGAFFKLLISGAWFAYLSMFWRFALLHSSHFYFLPLASHFLWRSALCHSYGKHCRVISRPSR